VSPKEFLFSLAAAGGKEARRSSRETPHSARKLPPSGTSPDEHHQKDVGERWKRGRAR